MLLVHRTVDKGTLYEREVYTDLDSPSGQVEALDATIANYLRDRLTMCVGKTARKIKNGYLSRRAGRRSAHEDWFKQVINNPTKAFDHPFYGKAA